MRRLPLLALFMLALLAFAPREVTAQIIIIPPIPTVWELRQNDLNPFCSNPGATRIEFQVPQQARVELVVLSFDGNQVLRTLIDATLAVGFHAVAWDGHDASNVPLPNGMYPYRMKATDAQSNVLFQDTKSATVECLVGVQPERWEGVKQHYR
jgi:hypothetical protein